MSRMEGLARKHPQAGMEGFTLAELLVVLVILGLLAAIVVPRLLDGVLGNANVRAAKAQISSFAATLDTLRLAIGRYPSSEEGLQALVAAPADAPGWSGPYLSKNTIPLDPWGEPYRYEAVNNGAYYRITTLGKDKAPGGEGENADISSDA